MATPLSGAAAPRLTSLLTRNLRPHLHRQSRLLSTRHPPPPTTSRPAPVGPPRTRDRGPKSKEDTQTDFGQMDMLASIPPPSTAVDACLPRGFALDSGVRVEGGGVLLVGGEALVWRPWNLTGKKRLFNGRGQLEVGEEGWGVLRGVWPKPDLLVVGTGEKIAPLAPETRRCLVDLGIRVEVQDTRNAAAQFNLLATERGVVQVAAALVPVGWKDGGW